jgi:NADH-quinone oxidoreductase E subunit
MSNTSSGAAAQADRFALTGENRAKADKIIAKYPPGRQASAVIPLLHLAQAQNGGWLDRAAMDHVSSFYTMFNLQPVGKHLLEICTTTPCWLRGSDAIVKACEQRLGIDLGETTKDGAFTLREVECLGACVNAPMMQIGDEYFEDLDPESTVKLIDALARGDKPKPGPQSSRHTSEPIGGLTTLTSVKSS